MFQSLFQKMKWCLKIVIDRDHFTSPKTVWYHHEPDGCQKLTITSKIRYKILSINNFESIKFKQLPRNKWRVNLEIKEGYSLDRIKMNEWIWAKLVKMTEKLTTTNIYMVNMTKNIIKITTTKNINGWIWQKIENIIREINIF